MDFLTFTLTIVITIIVSIIRFYKNAFKFWEKLGIPCQQPSIPFGTMNSPLNQKLSPGELFRESYFYAKAKGYRHLGHYSFYKPVYIPVDVEIVKSILSKDFHHFVDRGVYHNKETDPISAHLFSIEGNSWRNLRAKLTPTFTSGKMKMMFGILAECAENLKNAMDDPSVSRQAVDIKDFLARYTTDVIGSCAFGLDCNSFTNPNSDFRKYSKKAVTDTIPRTLKLFFAFCHPKLAKRLGVKTTRDDVAQFFLNTVKETVEYREENNVKRDDFLQLLIELKSDSSDFSDSSKVMKGLDIEEIAAQAFLFFVAGFETSSTTMMFILYELAVNPDIQEKVREEINEVFERHRGKLTYDCMMDLKYMRQVLDETLRKYPPVTVLFRNCVEDYKIPDTDITLKKDTAAFIPVMGLHYDPEFFPNPERFDPDRFSVENKHQILPFTYLPFGDGPRACIGIRFGIMQAEIGLALLLKNFSFSLNEKTTTPLKMDPNNFLISVLGDIWLNVNKV